MREHRYMRAPNAVSQICSRIMKEFHTELAKAKVKVDLVFCYADQDSNGQPKNHALLRDGQPVAGIASIVPLLNRALGLGDAMIKIDADNWEKMTDRQRDALIDHELEHFRVKKDELEEMLRDDLDRPRLVMHEHDLVLNGFKVIAERYGVDSVEVLRARDIQERAGEFLFDMAKV